MVSPVAARTAEFLRVLCVPWTGEPFGFAGERYRVDDAGAARPGAPIIIGGPRGHAPDLGTGRGASAEPAHVITRDTSGEAWAAGHASTVLKVGTGLLTPRDAATAPW
ncbi:hypothetical protein [Actinoplanes sp. NPDC049599]|uniref:hypothetical protein n=1 Tax=Actinoplanes sp. NPDC049599 TaxID=3363903 RepID=UPI0037A61C40